LGRRELQKKRKEREWMGRKKGSRVRGKEGRKEGRKRGRKGSGWGGGS